MANKGLVFGLVGLGALSWFAIRHLRKASPPGEDEPLPLPLPGEDGIVYGAAISIPSPLEQSAARNEGDVVHHQVDVRNTSTQAGQLVTATLSPGAVVTLGGNVLLRQTTTFRFSPGQVNRFDWVFTIPPGSGGQSVVVDVWVEAPDGRLLTPHVYTNLAVNQESGRFYNVVGEPDLNQKFYLGSNVGLFYALKTISIEWLNTSSSPIAGYISAVLHSDVNIGDQTLTPIAGNGTVIPPGGRGRVTFLASMPGPVIITATLSSPTRVLAYTGDWDTETRWGLGFAGIGA